MTTFARPTLEELLTRTESEVAARLGLGPLPRRSALVVLARVVAGLAHSAHGHLESLADELFPQTASTAGLERHASLRGLARKAATFAAGTATFAGTAGAAVPVGAALQSVSGASYEVTAAGVIGAGGTASVAVSATLPGAAGNLAAGAVLSLLSPVPGVAPSAAVETLEGGADEETDDELRARVLAAWRDRPMAGTAADYVAWALLVPGITRAWASPNTPSLGRVTVHVVADGNTPTIAPTAAQLDQVRETIDELRPVTAQAVVLAPTLSSLHLTLELAPGTDAVRAAVAAAVAEAIRRDAQPGGTIRLSRLSAAISSVPGELHHRIVSPAADVTAAAGVLHVPGVVTWS